ncbi:MAG: MFS transporter [Deltaproteobacteria bacterium]|nr:MFS transporter [Deltaproteobacteria bacterium]
MGISKYLVFSVVSTMMLLVSINGTAVAVAFPVLTDSFGASLILAGWVLSIYQLMGIISMPLAGKASDIVGKRFAFIISVFSFTLGCLLCALSPNIQTLIFSRLVQGVGYGATLPIGTGIVAEAYPESRQKLIGLLSSIFPIGQIIGPTIGGWMVTAYGWRSIFWLNVPLGIILMIATVLLIRPGKPGRGFMDLKGAAYMTGALLGIMLGMSFMGSKAGAILLAAAIVFMFFFLRHINRTENPIVDREIFRGRPFMAANLFNFVYGAAIFGVTSFIPLYVVSVYDMSTLASGLVLTPRSICVTLSGVITSLSLLRWGYRRPMLVGTMIIAFTLVLLGIELHGFIFLGIPVTSMTIMVVIMIFSGLGMGIVAPASNNACIDLMPERVAAITGVRGMFRTVGGAFSIVVITLLLENVGDVALGFMICFFGMAFLEIAVLPLIFAMPRGPIVADQDENMF